MVISLPPLTGSFYSSLVDSPPQHFYPASHKAWGSHPPGGGSCQAGSKETAEEQGRACSAHSLSGPLSAGRLGGSGSGRIPGPPSVLQGAWDPGAATRGSARQPRAAPPPPPAARGGRQRAEHSTARVAGKGRRWRLGSGWSLDPVAEPASQVDEQSSWL